MLVCFVEGMSTAQQPVEALFRRAKALLALGDAARAGVDLRRVLEAGRGWKLHLTWARSIE